MFEKKQGSKREPVDPGSLVEMGVSRECSQLL